jgi:hypothetical protein
MPSKNWVSFASLTAATPLAERAMRELRARMIDNEAPASGVAHRSGLVTR